MFLLPLPLTNSKKSPPEFCGPFLQIWTVFQKNSKICIAGTYTDQKHVLPHTFVSTLISQKYSEYSYTHKPNTLSTPPGYMDNILAQGACALRFCSFICSSFWKRKQQNVNLKSLKCHQFLGIHILGGGQFWWLIETPQWPSVFMIAITFLRARSEEYGGIFLDFTQEVTQSGLSRIQIAMQLQKSTSFKKTTYIS